VRSSFRRDDFEPPEEMIRLLSGPQNRITVKPQMEPLNQFHRHANGFIDQRAGKARIGVSASNAKGSDGNVL
jgi:hypothetical protein